MPDQANQCYTCGARRVAIFVGYSCNNNCRFCVVADKRSFADRTTEQIQKELKEAYAGGARQVVFTGGECTLRKDICGLVSFAKKTGFPSVQIQTNGRSFSSMEFCKKILLAGMSVFAPSLHGATADLHDELTCKKGSFRQTVLGIHNVRKLTKGKLPILTNTVIVKKNYRFLPEIARLLAGLGVYQMQFAFVHAQGNAGRFYKSVVPRKTDVVPYVTEALDIAIRAKIGVMTEAIPPCLLKGYEKYIAEPGIPSTEVREQGRLVERFEDVRMHEAKIKFPQCRRCRYDSICEGPWREYPVFYGNKEFQPVTIKK
ncbi:MAG: radical SAM protein [Candidatus Omnitrophica bacterium]|nr:radical SAM protein [Candidatus Omnitrophota bacterium]